MKKILGQNAKDHYTRINLQTGELNYIQPEFQLQSLKPGIGGAWYEKYNTDLIKGNVSMNGKRQPIPPYYMSKFSEDFPEIAENIKSEQILKALDNWAENTPERLAARKKVVTHKITRLIRNK